MSDDAEAPDDAGTQPEENSVELSASDIDALLKQANDPDGTEAAEPQPQANPDELSTSDIEDLLKQAEDALATADDVPAGGGPSTNAFQLPNLSPAMGNVDSASLNLIQDVELDLRIELGRTNMYLEDVLKLRKGAVVTLDKLAGDPVEIFVNGRLIARGEVLVLNENFCVRVAELVAGDGATGG